MTSTLCTATLSNSYVKRRLLYMMLRFIAVPSTTGPHPFTYDINTIFLINIDVLLPYFTDGIIFRVNEYKKLNLKCCCILLFTECNDFLRLLMLHYIKNEITSYLDHAEKHNFLLQRLWTLYKYTFSTYQNQIITL